MSGDWLECEDAAAVLYQPHVNGIVLFNHDVRSDLASRFDAATTFRPQLALKSISHRGDLEILTRRFELDPGETIGHRYTMELIGKTPID